MALSISRAAGLLFGRLAPTGAGRRPLSAAATLDFRRMKQRQGWVSAEQKVEEEEGDYFVFPRERLGNQYPLNYAINSHKIVPTGDAYRNLHARGLVMLASGKLDGNKALVVKSSPAVPEMAFRTFKRADEEFHRLLRDVRIYFSEAAEIFVHDGDLGAERSSAVSVRLFSDNAATALWAHHMLCPVALQDPRSRQAKLAVYVLTHLNTPAFVALDPDSGVAILNNVDDSSTLQAALLQLAQSFSPDFVMPDSFSLTLPASVFSPAPGKSDLLFHQGPGALPPFSELASSGFSLWNSRGLSRVFDGFQDPAPAATLPHALVETSAKAQRLMTARLRSKLGNILPHPSRTIFVTSSDAQPGLGSLNPDQTLQLAAAHNPLVADALKQVPVPGFILNTNKTTTPQQVSDLLRKTQAPPAAPPAWIKTLIRK